jgi:hypothetical protein
MKKVILTAAAVFAFGFANAQDAKSNDQKVKFGAKAGLNLSMLNGESGSEVGFHVGGVAEIKFNDKISLQPELMFSTEGGKYAYNGSIGGTYYTYNQEIKLNKIILPVMFKYYVIPNLSVEVGPQLDYIVSGKSNAELFAPDFNQRLSEDTDMNNTTSTIVVTQSDGSKTATPVMHDFGFKKLNFGVNFGAGYQLACGLFFQGRYNLGLTEFVTNANLLGASVAGTTLDPSHYGESFKNSNIQFSVGYKF